MIREIARDYWPRFVVVMMSFCALLIATSVVVTAHGGETTSTVGLSFPVVLTGSAVGGFLGGIIGYYCRDHYSPSLSPAVLSSVVGLALIVLAGVLVIETFLSQPLVATSGTIVGVALATGLRARWTYLCLHSSIDHEGSIDDTARLLGTIFVAIAAHRVLEGMTLGTIYATNEVIGVFGGVVLTVHMIVEFALFIGLWNDAKWHWVVIALTVPQGIFVLAAIGASVLAIVLPSIPTVLLTAIIGGLFLSVGLEELDLAGHHITRTL